jgi:hypothetical protein
MRRVLLIFALVAVSLAATVAGATNESGRIAVTLQTQSSITCTGRTLGAAVPYQLPFGQPSAVAVADFNNDGRLDVVAATADGTGVSPVTLFAGTSEGTLTPAGSTVILGVIEELAVDDFNGDGIQDLAASIYNFSGSARIFLGDGAGGFDQSAEFGTGVAVPFVTVGDFNGDGFKDLIVASWAGSTIAVRLLPGDGAGGLGPAVFLFVTDPISAMSAADLNADGRLDLVLLAITADSAHSALEVRLGQAGGGFGPSAAFPTGNWPTALALADLNGDGAIDAAITNGEQTSVSVFLGDGDGAFGPESVIPLAAGSSSPELVIDLSGIAAADFSGDGILDLAVTNRRIVTNTLGWLRGTGEVQILDGDGAGGFGPPSAFPVIGDSARDVIASDLDQDGRPDVVVIGSGDNFVSVLRNACGEVADVAVQIVESAEPALAAAELTYTITVTNLGPNRAEVAFNAVISRGSDFSSIVTTHGICREDSQFQTVPDLHLECWLGPLGGSAPGNTATITLVVRPSAGGSFTVTSDVSAGGTDPDGANNSDTETTSVGVLGGTSLTIGAAPGGGASLSWGGGDVQAGYLVARIVNGTTTILPSQNNPLPPSATTFTDAGAISREANCYVVAPVDAAGSTLGVSDMVCIVPNTASASGAPPTFTLKIDGDGARMFWSPPGGETGYALFIYPQDGSPSRIQKLRPTSTNWWVNLNGAAACFVLAPANGTTLMGHSDMLCAVPGVRTVPQ